MLEHRCIQIRDIEKCEFLAWINSPGISIQGHRSDGGTYEVLIPVQRAQEIIGLLSKKIGGKTTGRPKDL